MRRSTLLYFATILIISNLVGGFRTAFVRKGKPSLTMSTSIDVDKQQSARQTGLAFQLDEGTRKSHSIAENTAFVTGFFKGLANKEIFANLVCSLYHVYVTMEDVLDKSTDLNVKALDYRELRRKQSLEQDMEYYFGSEWKLQKPSPATERYCNHIRATAETAPYLMIAHQYTRYLGDLFGGQMMGSMATKSLNLEKGKGIAFYQFQGISNNKSFIEKWYTELNKLDLTEEQKQAIVDEGNIVFRLNIDIFDELDGNGLLATLKFAFRSLKQRIFK